MVAKKSLDRGRFWIATVIEKKVLEFAMYLPIANVLSHIVLYIAK